MFTKTNRTITDSLNIIWTIASKDIVDALKNRVVISMIIMLSIILLVPKLLPSIFEQTQTVLPVYDLGDSHLIENLANVPKLAVQELGSEDELTLALCGAMYPEIGLLIPVDIDRKVGNGEGVEFQGFVCWSKRHQVSAVQPKLEGWLSQALNQPVSIHIEGNIVYPPSDGVLSRSLVNINSVLMILMIGIFMVPSLLLEEKESKTMQALLVSPASIGQVVIGKALAGSFYILVTAAMIFIISWVDVIHWDIVIFFVIGGGFFSVAVGLVLGTFFEKQQDMVGWMTALLLLLVGTVFVKMLGVEVPGLVKGILAWVPSVALAEICRAIFSETVPVIQVWTNFGITIVVTLPLYALVIWKVKRFDR
jgi:ABC-2 type transport system permease protein